MKVAILALIGSFCLAGCSTSQEFMSNALRPGQELHISNVDAGITDFEIQANMPVTIIEADCTWHSVLNAHFTCPHASDIVIVDERSKLLLLGQPNAVTIRYGYFPRIITPELSSGKLMIIGFLTCIAMIVFPVWWNLRDPYSPD